MPASNNLGTSAPLANWCRRTLKQKGKAIEGYAETRLVTAEGRLGRLRYIAYGLGSFLVAGILLWGVVTVALLLTGMGASTIILVVTGVVIGIGYLVLYILWTIRRLHDFNVNAWFTFIFILPVINLILWLIPGTRSENNYGPMQPPNTLGVILSALVTPLTFIVLAAIAIPAYQDRPVWVRVYAEAQAALGWMYGTGSGRPQDYVKAVKWYRRAAKQGDANAQYSLGMMYYNGLGVSQDYVETVKWFRLAAEQGDADAQYSLGWMYDAGWGVSQDPVEALKWYRLAAEQGDARAQTVLGSKYENRYGLTYGYGSRVSRDYVEAVKWYRLAAEQGDALAQSYLGWMYYAGRGVPEDYAEALKWYRLAAEQGNAEAQYNLGASYWSSKGVAQDYVEAFAWLNLAAAQGQTGAAWNRGIVLERMTPAQVAQAQQLSRTLAQQIENRAKTGASASPAQSVPSQ